MKSTQKLTKIFDSILQRNIEITCNKKVIRKGVFILYTIKDYVITLIIKTPTVNKSYDIFYPFDVIEQKDHIVLDYMLDTILKDDDGLSTTGSNKFLNKKLKIKYV